MATSSGRPIFGVDFTSRPTARKPLIIAAGRLRGHRFELEHIDEHPQWDTFESWLLRRSAARCR